MAQRTPTPRQRPMPVQTAEEAHVAGYGHSGLAARGRVWFDRNQAGRMGIFCIDPPIEVSLAQHRRAGR
jgi:hypothetical protein